jgi:uncharacterized membrane protein YhaH (DUF805 family)
VGFTDAIKSCFNQFADAKGRAGRSEYWYFVLFSILVNSAADILDGKGHTLSDLTSLVLFVPGIAAAIRRMHDVGKSGWFVLVPFYNLYLAVQPSQGGPNQWGNTRTI